MSSVQMYQNVIGRVPQGSYFVAIVLNRVSNIDKSVTG